MAEFKWNSRKAFRIFFESQASVRLHRSSKKDFHPRKKTIPAKLQDLSAGGCAIESECFFPAGVKLNLFVDRNYFKTAPGKDKHYTKITGEVRTSRQVRSNCYRLGIQFLRVSADDRKLIKDFIDREDRREDKRITFPT